MSASGRRRRVFSLMRWGLIPSWAKDTSAAAGMINARSETAATKRAFRDPLRFRRCLVPGRLLRMAAQRNWQAALLLRGQRLRALRIRGIVKRVARCDWQWIRSCTILTSRLNCTVPATNFHALVLSCLSQFTPPGPTNGPDRT
jgi:putative SOS response-associated peptidase YedK